MPCRVSNIHIGTNGFGMERWRRTRAPIDRQKPDAILAGYVAREPRGFT